MIAAKLGTVLRVGFASLPSVPNLRMLKLSFDAIYFAIFHPVSFRWFCESRLELFSYIPQSFWFYICYLSLVSQIAARDCSARLPLASRVCGTCSMRGLACRTTWSTTLSCMHEAKLNATDFDDMIRAGLQSYSEAICSLSKSRFASPGSGYSGHVSRAL